MYYMYMSYIHQIHIFHRVHGVVRVLGGEHAHRDLVDCVYWHPHHKGLMVSCADDGSVALWGTKRYN